MRAAADAMTAEEAARVRRDMPGLPGPCRDATVLHDSQSLAKWSRRSCLGRRMPRYACVYMGAAHCPVKQGAVAPT